MTTDISEIESAALERLKEKFENEGYQFLLRPDATRLPHFLLGDEPDAIAFGPTETVLIEVKGRKTRASELLLKPLAQKVSSQQGWRLLVVYAGESPDVLEIQPASKSQIDQALKDIRNLMINAPNWVLLIAAWSTFEVLARSMFMEEDSISSGPISPMQIVERLASDGYVNIEEAYRLRSLISIRNRAAHGDLLVHVSNDDIVFMLDKANEINDLANS